MAKRKRMVKKSCPTDECGIQCFVAGVFGSAAAAIGLFLLVAGIILQTEGASLWNAGVWYLGGFFLMCIGKHILKKACPSCR